MDAPDDSERHPTLALPRLHHSHRACLLGHTAAELWTWTLRLPGC